ncbi:MAG: hypothetical protein A2219_00990 [Elusimicrobia bacterium RIFOXYA2_FULL_50_26]|nr:MAG: hypothetical protein A2219_00990 [Elusimicrobia bacterium RIFOXYA2_FULL_50_26]OGS22705.1 MAG: hypothetical protein A2314_08570 [Elusimicrobia bacterium RIFOXYB2_FULL_50_12]
MKNILSIARYTLVENIRNKIFYVLVFFGIIIIAASLLLVALGGEQQIRVLLDFGLAAIEFFALVTVCFAAVNLALEEMQSKTIYLVLTRPVSRAHYLIGRYAGLLAAVYSGMFLMALLHAGLLVFNGFEFNLRYPLALLLSAEKITIIGSVALFFSLFSSSAISSISFTVFFWVLGHFSEEIRYLGNKVTYLVPKIVAKIAYYTIPNLQYFNLRDFWDVPGITGGWIPAAIIYGMLYSVACMTLSLWLFSNKEF